MRTFGWRLLIGAGTLSGMTVLTLLATDALLDAPASDLAALAGFLLISGGVTVALGLVVSQFGLPNWMGSFRVKLALVPVLTAILVLGIVGFMAFLMFLSSHDLVLLAVLLGFSLGISIFVAFAFSDSTARSVREIVRGVRQMSAGSLGTRVSMLSKDEIGELATAFNAMAERLEAGFARERALEKTRKELISAVSHDLRTPLASIRVMIDSINDGVVTDQETIRHYLHTTQLEVEKLSQLITDLFELSQLDSGVLELHMEEASLQDLISDTLESMRPQAAARGVHLLGAIDGELPTLMMDARRVQRVLYNLVQNAIRHTPQDGTISIHARDADPEVQVEVSDTGEGIPQQELPHLFDQLYRSDRSRSRSSGGAGLGLSIAKGIVEAHGGRIWVAESTVGKGSTFSFALPKSGVNRQQAASLS
jgi:signal transduction histidine kinase